jgi:bifunctional non-homologous end joining protein LigD
VGDRLEEYRRKRDASKTPEPVPAEAPEAGGDNTFVIQQHHARSLHWDLRLERNGVLVSWAVPRGIPRDPARNHLAVNTEDHPMEYADFSGDIPAGEYGAGRMTIYDRGTYTTEKWRDGEVMVTLHGQRVSGRYVLFRTDGKDWMIHRMDPPEPGWTPMPELVPPMSATNTTRLPANDDAWAYELDWVGLRAVAYVSGGRLRLLDAEGEEITSTYPELRALAETLAPTECVLDGEIVVFDSAGQVSPSALEQRAKARKGAARTPVQYLVYDILWLDGKSTVEHPYTDRRSRLDGLGLAGPYWQNPPHFTGGGRFALQTSEQYGLPGVIAKRLDAPYAVGRRTRTWLRIAATPH